MARTEGGTVFLTTHNLVEAQRLCDRVGVMEHGQLVALGKPHDLARRLVRNLTVEFEIAPEDRALAIEALQAGPGKVADGQRNGLVAVTGAEREAIPDMIGRLVNAGVHIYEVIPQEPSSGGRVLRPARRGGGGMNWRAVFAIARKDLKVVWQNKGVSIPIIILPLILFVVLPLMLGLVPALVSIPSDSFAEVQQMLDTMPPALRASLVGLTMMQQTVVLFLVYIMAPLYLIVPMMVSSVVAADSFAGEKERKTLEALLYTPTSDRELLIAKMLGAWLPAVAVAWLGFALYAVVVNLAGWPTMGRVFFPNAMWLVLAIWVAPAVAGLGLASMVLVSVRAQGFQDAYQLGTLAILPIVILMIAQATGVIYFSVTLVLLLGLVLWIIDAVLIVFGNRTFRRSELIARM